MEPWLRMNVNALAEKLRVRVRRVRLSRMFPIVVHNPRFFIFTFNVLFLPRILSNTDEWSPQTIVDRILVDVEWTFEKLR